MGLFVADFREIRHLFQGAAGLAQKAQAVFAQGFVFCVDAHLVEKIVNGGAQAGAAISHRVKSLTLTRTLAVLMTLVSLQLLYKGASEWFW